MAWILVLIFLLFLLHIAHFALSLLVLMHFLISDLMFIVVIHQHITLVHLAEEVKQKLCGPPGL